MAPTPPSPHHHHHGGSTTAATPGSHSSVVVVSVHPVNTNLSPAGNAAAATEDATPQQQQQQPLQPDRPPRRFFPRIKHLLTSDWEYFLQGVVHSLEATGAPYCSSAGQNPNNPWYKAFHSVYGGVAADCSVPTGKNRYHKFKDKIVELWQAIAEEQNQIQKQQLQGTPSPGTTHHWTVVKQMAVQQWDIYKVAWDTRSNGKQDPDAKPTKDDGKMTLGGSNVNGNLNSSGKRRRQPNPMMQQHHQNLKKQKETPVNTTQPTETPVVNSTATLNRTTTGDGVIVGNQQQQHPAQGLPEEEMHSPKWKASSPYSLSSAQLMTPWSPPPPTQSHPPPRPSSQQLPNALQPLQSLQLLLEQCHEYKLHLGSTGVANTTRYLDDNEPSDDITSLRQQAEEQEQEVIALFQDEYDQAVQSDLKPLLQFATAHLAGNGSSNAPAASLSKSNNEENGSNQQKNGTLPSSSTETVAATATTLNKRAVASSSSPPPETILFLLEQWLWGLHRWRTHPKLPALIKASIIQPTYQKILEAYVTLRKRHHPNSSDSSVARMPRHANAISLLDDEDEEEDGEGVGEGQHKTDHEDQGKDGEGYEDDEGGGPDEGDQHGKDHHVYGDGTGDCSSPSHDDDSKPPYVAVAKCTNNSPQASSACV